MLAIKFDVGNKIGLDVCILNTFPGIKQHKFISIYLEYDIDSMEIRVSMHVKISECFASG